MKKDNRGQNSTKITASDPPDGLQRPQLMITVARRNSYIPVVGVHTTLLLFTALFLPRTTVLQDVVGLEIDSAQLSSRDHPQHPFLEPLTISPLSTLVYICLGTVVLQGWWAGYVRDWFSSLMVTGSENEKRIGYAILNRQKIGAFFTAWATTISASMIIHIILILFGAPILSRVFHTYCLALLIALLTVYTPAYVYGPPGLDSSSTSIMKRFLWIRLFTEFTIRSPLERALTYPAIASVVGAWVGAIPIALDWDRPWQAWPLTSAYGAIGGYTIASLAALTANIVA